MAATHVPYTDETEACDAYEGFVFSLVVSTALSCGATVHYRDVYGQVATDLLFRTSPGRLHSTTHPYTHAVIEIDNAPALEAHLGVYVLGNSHVQHECDVVILKASEAHECRTFGIIPRASACVCAIECKYYTSRLPLNQARGFVGLKSDLGSVPAMFVANTTSISSARYLGRRAGDWEHRVLPGSSEAEHLRSSIRKTLRDFALRSGSTARM